MKKDKKFDAIVKKIAKAKNSQVAIPDYKMKAAMAHWSNGFN